MERRFNEDLRRHEDDKYAHSEARHEQINDWISHFQIPMERRLGDLDKRVDALERWRYWLMGGIGLIAFEIPVVIYIFHR